MKLRSASLDDVLNELQFVLRADGRRAARFWLSVSNALYRAHRAFACTLLRRRWGCGEPGDRA